jgi:hypothetical protein
VQNNTGSKQYQQNYRTILQHPDLALKLNEELKIITLAVHVQTEKKYKKMERSEHGIKNESVSFHHSHRQCELNDKLNLFGENLKSERYENHAF